MLRWEAKSTAEPVGVNAWTRSAPGCQVRRFGSPPAAGMTNTSTLPSYSPLKATSEPSGENRGLVSLPGWEVRRREDPPSRLVIQRSPA